MCPAVWLILKIIEIGVVHFAVCDRKKKVEITLVQEDFDEIKHEHEVTRTPSTLFAAIGLSMSQIVLRQKTREKVPVRIQ